MADTLDDAAVADRLRDLPAWSRDGDEIRRRVKAPSFLAGIDVVTDVARAAEDADHHPDIDIRWRTLTFALTTHSAGGLTGRDFDLAATIDEIAARHGAE
ncbi:4a-hydroxytetrahydrobiopterin dehydratase [Actinomadura madurae]|uniref:4a-hydroxytetrahydrobiopterin dehydratase n=1 Tax=Actinomadura madurae TaxID=1993 RepID=UPI0020268292|nr:4a-hydroxytetrahydrobiopterin dehydratase [Actinomadura madurae]MCP9947642.1 4a-hydroxytetrahydrobiopterin dehydratase [Actinomadura madurae]MCP9964408.1 4a-hydroxytetrahydrobiopterin dehydratase [Actinomadura madurae]MCP9976890.1 4a-hydroxytetrahydrobiopterin dehydratase [Actinomadura madurae]MCQ0011616.1 4a-hydroxytetrahydrobiopterin dehydratase [Actinomadura madurae]MCQ0013076.1 4a-hydroxytetrahydrobiopterin dehydratase [Actinomadura madurae]